MAVRVDSESGLTKRLEHVDTRHGFIYTWSLVPPDAKCCVVVCSGVFGDFMANYHRERALGRNLASRGIAVIRFHYIGEGNSDGDRSEMTFTTLCENTRAILEYAESLGFTDFGLVGSRVGALVAAQAASWLPTVPLVLWEPITDPIRYLTEGQRAKKMSQVARSESAASAASTDWRAELNEQGVIDLLGYDIHLNFVESFEGVDLSSSLGRHGGPILLARFHGSAANRDRLMEDLSSDGRSVDRVFFDVAEPWWFDRETRPESGELLPATTRWLEANLLETPTP